MQLSDEDCGLIRKMANEVSAPNWQLPRKLMQAAYALGVERARKSPDVATRAVIGFVE